MIFIDTNVLVYAMVGQDPAKMRRARALLAELRQAEAGVLSLQVLRELASVLYRKSGWTDAQVRKAVEEVMAFPCVRESMATLKRGMALTARHGLQFSDALVVAAAEEAGCDTVYSEDMGDGAVYGGVRVVNPFAG